MSLANSRFVDSPLALSRAAAPPPRPLLVGSLFAVAACVLAGPFETGWLPLASRLVFWLVLIGWNSTKWWLWYAWVGPRAFAPGMGRRGALLMAVGGALLLNALLPLEIDLMFTAIGQPQQLPWLGLYLSALVIAGGIASLVATLAPRRGGAAPAQPAPAATAPPPVLAQRAGLADLSAVRLVRAEDHYLRLVLADGRQPLLLFRMGDALVELAGQPGCQVHRGVWVAAAHVRGARRDGRRWLLQLADGSEQPVSASCLPQVRAAGWLHLPAAPHMKL